jgi:hypothetical protein
MMHSETEHHTMSEAEAYTCAIYNGAVSATDCITSVILRAIRTWWLVLRWRFVGKCGDDRSEQVSRKGNVNQSFYVSLCYYYCSFDRPFR